MQFTRIKKPSKPFLQMNKIFSFRRFSEFLLYELKNFKSRHLNEVLLLGLIPLMMGLITIALTLFRGDSVEYADFSSARSLILVMTLIIPLLFPAKVYGFLTEKKAGGDWALIPASQAEKYLCMLVILLLVVPAAIVLLLFCSDSILATAFPLAYGEGVIVSMLREIPASFLSLALAGFVNTNLVFLLGALCFKKAKVAKTVLSCFLVSALLTLLGMFFGIEKLSDGMMRAFLEFDIENINIWANIYIFGFMALFAAAVFFRLRNIKY